MVSYFGNPESLTVTSSPACGTLTPIPSETLPPGLTDSVLSATVRVGATGFVGVVVCVPLVPPEDVPPEDVLPEEVLPVGSVTGVPDGRLGVEGVPVLPPDVVPDEEVPVVLPEVLPDDVVPSTPCQPFAAEPVTSVILR